MRHNNPVKARGKVTYLRSAKAHHKQIDFSNKSIIGTLVSGLAANTVSAQVAIHVRRETGLTIKPEKLKHHKDDEYASFFIRCGEHVRYRLMDEYLWPEGATIKPYWA